jgi:putative membrane protein
MNISEARAVLDDAERRRQDDPVPPVSRGDQVRRLLVWVLLGALLLRFAFAWADTFAGASLPRIGSSGFTLIFAAFSILHASDLLGWRRALIFLVACVVISWGFESVGVATGAVYGNYHYSDALGVKVGAVPFIIPLAWFMMVYASWIVAHILLADAGNPASIGGALARAVIAAAAMTSWDVVMDPGMARKGVWTWENGGAYFGVPFQNFVGWMLTTLTVYVVVALIFRGVAGRRVPETSRLYVGLPALAYTIVAIDQLLNASAPELYVVAAFGICLLALLALLRLALVPTPVPLPR